MCFHREHNIPPVTNPSREAGLDPTRWEVSRTVTQKQPIQRKKNSGYCTWHCQEFKGHAQEEKKIKK